jgi:hypothetical protein
MDRLFRARGMPIIPVALAGRRATASSMHATAATATDRRRTTWLPRSFRFGFAARRVVGALHGVAALLERLGTPEAAEWNYS